MNLSDINQVSIPRKRRKRVGRGEGSGNGKTAGKGMKGQQSRSGYSRRLGHEGGQMPLFRRLPKRGFTNAPFKVVYDIVNLEQLGGFEAGAEIDLALLKSKGLLPKNASLLKVLGKGTLDVALTVRAHRFSETARQAIEAAGGKADVVDQKAARTAEGA